MQTQTDPTDAVGLSCAVNISSIARDENRQPYRSIAYSGLVI